MLLPLGLEGGSAFTENWFAGEGACASECAMRGLHWGGSLNGLEIPILGSLHEECWAAAPVTSEKELWAGCYSSWERALAAGGACEPNLIARHPLEKFESHTRGSHLTTKRKPTLELLKRDFTFYKKRPCGSTGPSQSKKVQQKGKTKMKQTQRSKKLKRQTNKQKIMSCLKSKIP